MSSSECVALIRKYQDTLKVLYDLCIKTNVTHGQGDQGNVLSYHEGLRRTVENLIGYCDTPSVDKFDPKLAALQMRARMGVPYTIDEVADYLEKEVDRVR